MDDRNDVYHKKGSGNDRRLERKPLERHEVRWRYKTLVLHMLQIDTKRMWRVYKITSTHFLNRISRRVHLAVSSLFLPFLLVDSPTPWHTAMLLRLWSGHQTRGSAKIRRRETCLKFCWIIVNFPMLALRARNVPRRAAMTFCCSCINPLLLSCCRDTTRIIGPSPILPLILTGNHNYMASVQVCTNRSKGNVASSHALHVLNVTFEYGCDDTLLELIIWYGSF